MVDLTKLDAAKLTAFVDGDLTNFGSLLNKEREPGRNPPSMYDTGNSPHPVQIGQMGGDDNTGGKGVFGNAQTAAKAIDNVFNKHATAFGDLESTLHTVISTMLKTQGDNLASVDGQKFLTAIGAYDHDISGTDPNSIPPPGTGTTGA